MRAGRAAALVQLLEQVRRGRCRPACWASRCECRPRASADSAPRRRSLAVQSISSACGRCSAWMCRSKAARSASTPASSAPRQSPSSAMPASLSTIFRDEMMPRTRRSRLRSFRSRAACDASCCEQRAADQARPDQSDRDGVRRQVERRVHRAQRPGGVLLLDDDRDVPLRRALRDGAHVDRGLRQRAEDLRRGAGRAGHAVADHREDAAVGRHRTLRGSGRARSSDSKACRTIRSVAAASDRGTAKQIECSELACEISTTEMLMLAQRGEQALRGAGDADHAGALDVDQRHLIDRGDALHRRGLTPAWRRSACRRAPAQRYSGSGSECPSPPPAPSSADAAPWRRNTPAPSLLRTTSDRSRSRRGRGRGSALSTPSTSVQMTISAASSRSPKIAPEKSLPLRPSVVCRPCSSRATKPGAISIDRAGASGQRRRIGA